jgi:hypothetical protein
MRTGATQHLRRLASSPEGVTVSEACRVSGHSAKMLSALARHASLRTKAVLHRVEDSGAWRYFTDRDAAQAWAQRHGRRVAEATTPLRKTGRGPALTIKGEPAAVKIGPTRGPAHLPGDLVITPQTKVTICPAPPDSRYAVLRVRRHVRAAECRPWAEQAAQAIPGAQR